MQAIIPCAARQHVSSDELHILILYAASILMNMFYHPHFDPPLHSLFNIHSSKSGK
jgi:hypothetical protein